MFGVTKIAFQENPISYICLFSIINICTCVDSYHQKALKHSGLIIKNLVDKGN